MSEKKERGEGGYHATGTHPTNASRAKAKWRENAGLSPSTFMDAKPNKFIPHAVRAAGLRKQGYTPSEARRIASYQSSTAGLAQTAQNTGEAGELPDARVNPPMYQPPQGGRRSGGARNADMLVDQSSEAEPPPTGTPAAAEEAKPEVGSDEAKPEVGSDEWRKGVTTARTPAQQAQANFSKALKDGTITPDKVKQAEAFAASKGWNFDKDKGYSMPESLGGTASYERPDGTTREIVGNRREQEARDDDMFASQDGKLTWSPPSSTPGATADPAKTEDEDMFASEQGKLNWTAPSNSRASGESPGKQASRASGPAEQTQGFEKQDLEMLPDTVAGRARGAKAGNSYRSENGDVWRNDGDGGYNVEKAGGESPLSGKQRDDFDAYKAGLDAEYKERFPRGHDKDGPVKKTTKQPEPTVDITNIDTIPVDKPNENRVLTGEELQKEARDPRRDIYPPGRIQQGFNIVKGAVSSAMSARRKKVEARRGESKKQRTQDFDSKLSDVNSRREKLGKPPVKTLSGGFERPGTKMLEILQENYKSGNFESKNFTKADVENRLNAIAKEHGFKFNPGKGFYQ